jgi:predicted enzyme related to lactoylglutathione lyase
MVRLNEVELFVPDLASALRLYRDLIGVPLKGHSHAEGEAVHYHASWGTGVDFLLLSVYEASPGDENRTSLGFDVTGLDELHARVQQAGLRVVQDIQTRPWGSRTALYVDARGNRIWLSERLPVDVVEG